ncbi:hypothetical protein D049_1866B, partial [Vibrio parahaemolyticus VPTS-2010]
RCVTKIEDFPFSSF